MADDVVYVRHLPAEFHAFKSPDGICGRWTKEQAEKVAAHARLLAPKPGQGRGYATGELAGSIRSSAVTVGRKGPESTVSAGTDHAVFVHDGTEPHTIKPRFAKKLVFFWRKAGRVVSRNSVHHPGTPANPFLSKALQAVFGGPGR
jgi:hypothetical protein